MPARSSPAVFRPLFFATAPAQSCLLTACAALALILTTASESAHAQAPSATAPRPAAEAVPVIVASSTELPDTVTLELPGSGLAQRSVTLFPLVDGEVNRVLFRTGQAVTAGQLLVQLSDRAEQLAVDLAAARLQTASLLARRLEATAGSGAVPEIEVEQAVAVRRSAEIELAQARQALTERSVRAPFAGVMGIAGVERGDRVSPTTALTTLDDRRQLVVAFSVAEAHLNRLRPGQTITATHPAYPSQAFTGRVSEIDSQIDPLLRTVRVRATMPNTEDRLRTGMSFRVRLVFEGEVRVSVPALTLQFDREGSFVWAVREGKAQRVAARVVRRSGERVLVDSELASGEPVVVEGVQRLRPGRAVRVVGERAIAASAP
jgi:membrane fusion protein, multidrug efflux system